MPFAAQIRGNFVLSFRGYEAVPTFADVLATPPGELQDGDTVVIVDETTSPPTITAQGRYSHPAPVISVISNPVT